MKLWMSVAAGLLAAAGLGVATAALEGGYTSPSGAHLEFDADGLMHVSLPDGNAFAEAYVLEGDQLTITSADDAPHDCPGSTGVYQVAESEAGVVFTLVADTCEQRSADLTSGVWTKAAE